ncbi:COG1470 family protein [Streptosporangium sp. G11]|uniref:COG1470 family protein n=1 Tax=Streptosporangium sp. G11 TaxID=3436926 RepID=UPI003EB87D65
MAVSSGVPAETFAKASARAFSDTSSGALAGASARVSTDLASAPRSTDLTSALRARAADLGEPGGAPLGPSAEVAQPVFSRYWLHNRGAAPLGYQPMSVSLRPSGEPGAGGRLRVTLASDLVDTDAEGHLRIVTPPGWDADPGDRPVLLGPGGWTSFEVDLTPAPDAGAGPYVIAAQLTHGGQVHEDVLFVDGRGRPAPGGRTGLLEVEPAGEGLTLAPGRSGRLTAVLRNHAGFDIRGEAQVISPWGTWDAVRTASHPLEVAAGGGAELHVDVTVPPGTRPGSWWVLLKCMWFGRLSYSPAVPLLVRDAG